MVFPHYLQTVMKMYIPRVLRHHFGTYACKAKNPRGDTDGIITLSGKNFFASLWIFFMWNLNRGNAHHLDRQKYKISEKN